MKIIGPLTATKQSYDGRRTLNSRGLALFVLLVVLTFGLVPVDRSIARTFGALLFFLLIGGGAIGAGLSVRGFRSRRRPMSTEGSSHGT